MTKIIPTGVIGWKIIPVGSMYRVYHMKPGRCYWKYRSGWLRGKLRGRCLSVEVRPWSAWPVEPKRPHGRMEIVRKEHSKGSIMFLTHERICGRFRRYCSDVWGCMHRHVRSPPHQYTHTPYGISSSIFTTVRCFCSCFLFFVPVFCIPEVTENRRNEVDTVSSHLQFQH